ncbi:MAG: hypothetical protein II113_06780, partial [Firmicutes bacterium]|nr:hypothetical protein [Bacillota bacterium]
DDLLSISEKRKISAQFIPDAGKASDIIREIKHEGRGLIIGASWGAARSGSQKRSPTIPAFPWSQERSLTESSLSRLKIWE